MAQIFDARPLSELTPEELRRYISKARTRGMARQLEAGTAEQTRRRFATSGASPEIVADISRTFDAIKALRGTRASRAEKSARERGIIYAIANTVNRGVSDTLRFLASHGRLDLAFESIVARHPDAFDTETRTRAIENLAEVEK